MSNPKDNINEAAAKREELIRDIRTELYRYLYKLDGHIRNFAQTVSDIRDVIYTILGAHGIWLYDKEIHKEDKYLLDILRLLWSYHDMAYNYHAVLHYRYDNHEFDLVMVSTSANGKYPRVAIVEFKESNFPKLVDQALARVEYADYVYIAYSGPLPEEFAWRVDQFQTIAHHGIGFIYLAHDPVVIAKAKMQVYRGGIRTHRAKYSRDLYNSVVSWIQKQTKQDDIYDELQRKIVDYLTGKVIDGS